MRSSCRDHRLEAFPLLDSEIEMPRIAHRAHARSRRDDDGRVPVRRRGRNAAELLAPAPGSRDDRRGGHDFRIWRSLAGQPIDFRRPASRRRAARARFSLSAAGAFSIPRSSAAGLDPQEIKAWSGRMGAFVRPPKDVRCYISRRPNRLGSEHNFPAACRMGPPGGFARSNTAWWRADMNSTASTSRSRSRSGDLLRSRFVALGRPAPVGTFQINGGVRRCMTNGIPRFAARARSRPTCRASFASAKNWATARAFGRCVVRRGVVVGPVEPTIILRAPR